MEGSLGEKYEAVTKFLQGGLSGLFLLAGRGCVGGRKTRVCGGGGGGVGASR